MQKIRKERDPIDQVRTAVADEKRASEDELKKIDTRDQAIVNEAAQFARPAPEPDPSELWTDVYALSGVALCRPRS